jgi:hypothetical protein
VFNYP